MDNYCIIAQQNPQSRAVPVFSQQGFFFHERPYLQQQDNGQFHLFSALNQRTQQADARCAFFVRSDKALSPLAAPFGSIEFTENLPDSVLDTLIESILYDAQRAGATTLRFVNYPACYAPNQTDRLLKKLLAHGFELVENHPTFFLPINTGCFETNLVAAERRRLRKCRQAGLQATYQPRPNVAEIVSFLVYTRQQKGYPLTISADHLTNLLVKFPEQYPVFTVTDGNALAAVTIAVRIRHDILYNFLPASHPDYATFSPMVLLTEGLFRYCQQQHIRLLDLGLSLDHHRQPKLNLMRFKRNLGAQESPKLVFGKMF